MIFYVADTHFSYEPLVESRGFGSAAQMDEALIENWNNTVSDEDTVYLVGDIGYNEGYVPCEILDRLKGRKHLIRGNHDTRYENAQLLYRYFETVTDFLEIDDGNTHILLSHYPLLYNKRGYMIHGHLHNGDQFYDILKNLPRMLNCGVDLNGMKPVTLEELVRNNEIFYANPPVKSPYRPRGRKGYLPGVPDFRPIPERPKDFFEKFKNNA